MANCVIELTDGTKKIYEVTEAQVTEIDKVFKETNSVFLDDDDIRREMNNWKLVKVSPEVKSWLYKLRDYTVYVGGKLIHLGKKIIEIIISIAKRLKNTIINLIIAAVLSYLLTFVPILGGLLAFLASDLLMLLGFTTGIWADIRENLKEAIEYAMQIFSPLKAIKASA